jgi:hypothetical protein
VTVDSHRAWRPVRAPGAMRVLTGPCGVLALAAPVVALVALVDPNEPGHYPTCPFLLFTGLFCPGCGALRAVHALAHGRVDEALGLNPLVVVASLWLVVEWAGWVTRRLTGRPRTTMAPAWVLWCVLATIVAFGVLRNLPGFAFLAP